MLVTFPHAGPIVVRPARADDLETIVALNTVVQAFHATRNPDYFKVDPRPREVADLLAEQIRQPGHHVFIASIRERAVGYVWCEVQDIAATALTHRLRRLFVHHVAVAEGARRRGVGSALLDEVDGLARSRGIDRVDLSAWSFNEPARRLFEKRGFAVFSVNVSKTLVQPRQR